MLETDNANDKSVVEVDEEHDVNVDDNAVDHKTTPNQRQHHSDGKRHQTF